MVSYKEADFSSGLSVRLAPRVLQNWRTSNVPLKSEGVCLGSASKKAEGTKAQAELGQICSSLGL